MIKKFVLISCYITMAMILISCNREPNLQSPKKKVSISNQLGINAFEWDFLQDPVYPADGSKIFEPRFKVIKTFSQFRHYLDWEKLEFSQGKYTFNQTRSGGWNLDVIYQRCKEAGIEPLVCIKTIPNWLYKNYPISEQTNENIPVKYPSDRSQPSSYIEMAKVGFQFAARYGSNTKIDSSLVSIDTSKRWRDDIGNVKKIGLNTIKYIECNNEPDKWWRGKHAMQTAEEYAANLSAFYDGDMGKLGKNVGVKTADPNITVVMGGLATPKVEYVKAIVEWCRKNRGVRADGSVNLCFDVINYHLYANNNDKWLVKLFKTHRGIAPEKSNLAEVANEFVNYARTIGNDVEVWNTESGYDVDLTSPQKAIAIKGKSALITQADWVLRSSLLYARHGVNRTFYYMLSDLKSPLGRFASSGFIDGDKRRPVADYFYQVKNLMGNYSYKKTININPIVDVYTHNGKKMYVLVVPDEVGREEDFTLNVVGATKADIFTLKPGNDKMDVKRVTLVNGLLKLKLTETPIFVRTFKK